MAPQHVQHISPTHTMLALVGAGLGVALVPEAARSLRFEGIALRPLRLPAKAAAELFAVWRRDNKNPALQVLRDRVLHGLAQKQR